MPFKSKIDILAELKAVGYSTYRLRMDKIFGEATIQRFRKGELASWNDAAKLCKLLNLQPGDIIEYKDE